MTTKRKRSLARSGDVPASWAELLSEIGIPPGANVSAADVPWQTVLKYLSSLTDRALARRLSELITERAIAATGVGMDLAECDLAGYNLEGLDLRRATLNRANLSGTDLSRSDLRGASIICPVTERLRADGARFDDVYSHATAYQVATFRGSSWRNARDVTGALFHGCALHEADFSGAVLSGVLFYQCEFENTNFVHADLTGCVFNECVIKATSFDRTRMTDTLFLQTSITDTSFARCHAQRMHFNNIRTFARCSFADADITRATVDQSSLEAITFAGAKLDGAIVRDSTLTQADFTATHAPNITLLHVAATEMLASGADFRGASWVSSSCRLSIFSGSALEHSRFDDCSFHDVTFSDRVPAKLARLFGGSSPDSSTLAPIKGRAMSIRNSIFVRCDFQRAYLYRAMFTGDHIKRLVMDGCDFTEAILVQSYLSGSFVRARFRRAELAYSRLNQSDLRTADFTNANLFDASLVKVELAGANFGHVTPPFFIDRAKGLDAPDTRISTSLRIFMRTLSELLAANKARST